jgi:DNA modification methylase
VPAKNLLGLPWRLALALQAAGWWLRQDIIWAKKAPLPESVQDRCTKSHEYLFLLSRHPTYYFDATAIRESASANTHARYAQHGSPHTNGLKHSQSHGGSKPTDWAQEAVEGRNKRSVWHLGPEPSAAAHFATFPQKLVEPCVLAGSSAYGVCSACGAPWRRCVEQVRVPCHGAIDCLTRTKPVDPYDYGSAKTGRWSTVRNTTGWQPTCSCRAGTSRVVVLDPFGGSGTTGLVAAQHGRDAILIDLSAAYLDLAVQRLTPALAQLPLF